jgi:hypothetical protein
MRDEQATVGRRSVMGEVDTHKDLHVVGVVDAHDDRARVMNASRLPGTAINRCCCRCGHLAN